MRVSARLTLTIAHIGSRKVNYMARPKAFDETQAIERATEIFWRKGYHQTSMQDLVDGMGINRASLYDTFGDKHTLYLKTLAFYKEKSQQEQTALNRLGLSPRDQIRAFLTTIVEEEMTDTVGKGCFFTNTTLEMLPNDPAAGRVICQNFGEIRKMLAELISIGQQTGDIKNPQSAVYLAFFVQSSIAGLRVMGRTRPTREIMLGVVENVMQVLK